MVLFPHSYQLRLHVKVIFPAQAQYTDVRAELEQIAYLYQQSDVQYMSYVCDQVTEPLERVVQGLSEDWPPERNPDEVLQAHVPEETISLFQKR